MKTSFSFVLSFLVLLLVVLLGGFFTGMGVESWYSQLVKPSITPPQEAFGPVWMSIYVLAFLSVTIVLKFFQVEEHGWLWKLFHRQETELAERRKHWIIGLFLVNAFLNVFWSYLFFVQHWLVVSFWEMILLNLTTIALVVLIWPISRWASVFLLPYVFWVTFASVLTYQIVQLN